MITNGWVLMTRKAAGLLPSGGQYSKFEAYADLLLMANFNDGHEIIIKGEKFILNRGQFAASYEFLRKRWGWLGKSKITRFIDHLARSGLLIKGSLNRTLQLFTLTGYCEIDYAEQKRNDEGNRNGTGKIRANVEVSMDCEVSPVTPRNENGTQCETETEPKRNNKEINKNIIYDAISYLNSKCKTQFRTNAARTIDCINARIREGYGPGDFRKVIDVKWEDWHGSSYEKFLRPETLFGPKFESYLNQKSAKGPSFFVKMEVGGQFFFDKQVCTKTGPASFRDFYGRERNASELGD